MQSLLAALAAVTPAVYIVGGVVRDHLLGVKRPDNDLDVVVEHSALQVARRVGDQLGWAFYPLDTERDVARLVFMSTPQPLVCDITAMRGGAIEQDLLARDFTINALAMAWQGRAAGAVIDVVGGCRDLEQRLLRRVTAYSLAEDPVRLLRSVRFVAQLGFALEQETELQILRMPDTVQLASAERVRDELWKTLQAAAPAAAAANLHHYRLLQYTLPEVVALAGVEQSAPHVLDVYDHTLQTTAFAEQLRAWLQEELVAPTPAALAWQKQLQPWRFRLKQHFWQPAAAGHLRIDWLIWYALLHDIGKPQTRTLEQGKEGSPRYRFFGHDQAGAALARARLEALRFSRQEIQLAESVIAGHMRPHQLHASFGAGPISRRACFHFFRDTGGRNFDSLPGVDIVLLALADYQATYMAEMPPDWDGYLQHVVQLLTFAFDAQGLEQVRRPLVDGHTLMRYLNLSAGPEVGHLLEKLQEAQAAGEIATREEALVMAATWAGNERT